MRNVSGKVALKVRPCAADFATPVRLLGLKREPVYPKKVGINVINVKNAVFNVRLLHFFRYLIICELNYDALKLKSA